MFAKYGYILPLIVLLLYTEYKKRRFLKEANKTDVDVRNINFEINSLKILEEVIIRTTEIHFR